MAEQQGNVTFTYTKTFDKVWDDGFGSQFDQTPEKNLSPSTYNVGESVVESDLSRPEFSKWQVNRETERYWTFLPNQKLRGWDGKEVDGINKYFESGDWGYPTTDGTLYNMDILPIYMSETLTDYDEPIHLPIVGTFMWNPNVQYSEQTIVTNINDRIHGKLLRGETVTINGSTYLIQNIVFDTFGQDNSIPYDGIMQNSGTMTLMSPEPKYKPIQDPAYFGMYDERTWYIGEKESYGDYSAKWPDRMEYNFETEADVWTFLEENNWNDEGEDLDFVLEYQFPGFSPQPNLEDEDANDYQVGYLCGYDCHVVSWSVYGDEGSGNYNGDGFHGFVVEVGDDNSLTGHYGTPQILIEQKAYYQYHIEEGAHWERVDDWKEQYTATEPSDSAENASDSEYDGSPIYPYTITYTVVGTNYMYQLTNKVQNPADVTIASGGVDPMPVADESSPSTKTIVVPFTYIVEETEPSSNSLKGYITVCGRKLAEIDTTDNVINLTNAYVYNVNERLNVDASHLTWNGKKVNLVFREDSELKEGHLIKKEDAHKTILLEVRES